MEHIVQKSAYPESKSYVPKLRLSPFLLIVFIALVGFAVVTIGASLVAQYRPAPLNPFPAYADVFPGRPASAVETRAFSCQNYAPAETACIFTPAAGAFLSVQAVISEGTIHNLAFILRDNTLRVGDLAQLLGTPAIHRLKHTAFFLLPTGLVRVEPVGRTKQFSLFLPVSSVTFMTLS